MKLTGLKRDTKDKYYTCPNTVNLCIETVKNFIFIGDNDLIIEPSAGNGAFNKELRELSHNTICLDIDPQSEDILKQDYLFWKYPRGYKKIHVIGNPPFGRQSSIVIRFIKHSAVFCDTISFILPRSFKKHSLQKHFPPEFHLLHCHDLPKNSFIIDDTPWNVPCVFQIWEKRNYIRPSPKILEPLGFSFVKPQDADISLRRVGARAGQIGLPKGKSISSHYFIKFHKVPDLNNLKFEDNNTVGPRSISKQEVISQLNPLHK